MARPERGQASAPDDPAAPVALFLELRADTKDSHRLQTHAAAFVARHPNAALWRPPSVPPHLPVSTVVVYIAIDGGALRGAVRGESAEARHGTATFVAAMNELLMFDPVLVPRPTGYEKRPTADAQRPRGAA